MNKRIQILSLLFLGFSQVAFSQIQDEKLFLNRKREPEVKKIEKKKTSIEAEKNYPPEEKSANPPTYNITNVPASSDFKTSLIQGEDISPKFEAENQNNYFQLGMGNYGKILADGLISTKLENDREVGGDVHFLSTNGLKNVYNWDSKQSSANIGAFLNSYGELGKFSINADYGLNDYNYYGIYAIDPGSSNIDLKQKTNRFKVNGYYDFYSNEILNDVRLKSSFLSDHFGSKENQAEVLVNLSKHGVDLPAFDDVRFNADLGLNLETVKTDFDIIDKNSSQFLNAILAPKMTFFKGNSYLMIGSDFSFLNAKNSNLILAEQMKNSKTYWFPKAELQFAAADEFKFYGGITGGLHLNTYADLLEQNPYLISDQELRATETKYKFYFGLRGDIDQQIKYDFSAGFGKMNDILFFRANELFNDDVNDKRPAYDFANTFSSVYDNGKVSEVKGSVQFFPLANLALDGELNFAKYNLDNNKNIYYKPLIKASLGGKYSMLDKKLTLGAKAIFGSDMTTNSFEVNNDGINPNNYISTENTNDKVGGFADLNLSAEYKVHKNFSIFALGNNLLNTQYQTYKGYKVLGAQILGGVKISF
ncbi:MULTISPECIES: TonB-dependent receptor [unclassified Kaistella]|uniref:TonB-dependent receptor n=1 Tax=unclassified Kaistella TaxID=2762626 RepID=UPI0027360DA0|nr:MULTISPECIES: TonB-dependent receptor [unclassified Kaistella]MDP2453142.1 TonB-dependent receptor [Kaistella sp. SH11-4b]MDP2456199.1 TonB-dependent receptor [Kaistella sp. SH40-3]MDP2458955.1 TonB-dependent receptor [Kaistella sp. SH19-2b]